MLDLRHVLSLRPLSRLLIVSVLPASGLLAMQVPMPSTIFEWVDPLASFLWSSGLGFLLLLVWLTRYLFLGYPAWALALAAATLSPLGLLLPILRSLPGAAYSDLSPLFIILLQSAAFTFSVLFPFGWGLANLRRPKLGVLK
ncbi:hypothetical protein [uncultured Deinococcus sp.]|uniref:hypothetical protein n=1 Tax=uncultured Deinococcus sp. TaxID=158789 RepID=UPI0025E9DE62|nr:hypothetical protein [uncultured Deinococcus sp.]